jgi:CRISPR-associated endonuclease/helicase Cas3
VKPSDFDPFFEAIHGHAPFPWQSRLAHEVCETNLWPSVLDLPTGSGKTSCIDVALFHWLVSASRGSPADAARRIAFVVDRRIIVDEATERAAKIASAIAGANKGILDEARRLLNDCANDPNISVFTLRGGVARERNLVRDPLRVTVVLSTVDQIGSRLLFRGYGVADGMKPIHAGVFGTDTLLLLDEAHIAEPLRQTLEGIVREQARASVAALGPKPLRWVQLSATPTDEQLQARVFSLADDDRAHPVLSRRLFAKKPMRLWEVEKRDELPGKLADLVKEELSAPPLAPNEQPRIGIVVNRVATARALHETLKKALKESVEVELLIGRTRPLDRDEYLRALAPKLKSSTSPRSGDKPIVVVATQTIEVGADFDFHALFIEAASYAAIKQRVGRLNRLGVRDAARGAIVLVRADADDDPIYGATIGHTWTLLRAHAKDDIVDLGISVSPPPTREVQMGHPPTPQLSPSLLSLLVQTSPRPAVEPSVTEFLHGFATQVPDVSVVWRDGLTGSDHEIDEACAREVLRVMPPLSVEAMSLPYSTFRQWVSGWGAEKARKIVDGGDLEGDAPPTEEAERERIDAKVLLVDGGDVMLVRADSVRPGAQVVVPSAQGGADKYGWKPEGSMPVPDLSLVARDPDLRAVDLGTSVPRGRRERTLVWTPQIGRSWLRRAGEPVSDLTVGTSDRTLTDKLADPDATLNEAREAFYGWLEFNNELLPPDVRATSQTLRDNKRSRLEWLESKGELLGLVLREGKVTGDDLVEGRALQRTVRVPLTEHLRTVGALAEVFARGVGLPESLVVALRVAGTAHDLGKADPRFQRRLCATGGELLAKNDVYDERVPRGERHEVYSVAVLDQFPELCADVPEHRALIRYLVGSHHGFGRGVHPVTDDRGTFFDVPHGDRMLSYTGRPAMSALGSGWADLFVSQNRAYGPWTLAFLESILRLADHRRSEQEVQEHDDRLRAKGEGA